MPWGNTHDRCVTNEISGSANLHCKCNYILVSFTCEFPNTCCQVLIPVCYKLFRPAFNANASLRGTASRRRDVFIRSWMRLCVRASEIMISFRECGWLSKQRTYFGPYVDMVGYRCAGRSIHPVVNTVGFWNERDIFIRSSILLDVEMRYFRPFFITLDILSWKRFDVKWTVMSCLCQ